ncbi:MAG: hypothetical protein QM733_23650 [Ilumatobacteraceae bacterium]
MAAPKVRIKLNEDRIRITAGIHPVADIKVLATPPVPHDHTLWIDVPGGADVPVANDGTIEAVENLVLFSVGPDGAHPKHMDIVIDGTPVVSENQSVTGAILRRLVNPPIPATRDLFREIAGAPDERITDEEEVTLIKGAVFYSVPALIAPGRS